MKNIFSIIAIFFVIVANAQTYMPSKEIIQARSVFQDQKFGMFIHWGASSVLGNGEWVMETQAINKEDYKKLLKVFNPIDFDAAKWVSIAKNAGMKYIVLITRHHDGFSNWDTKYSDWKITNTHYKQDPLKLLAAECKKQGLKLGLYYSTLDWSRDDYPYETGRTGQKTGRTQKSNYASYLAFMKNQLTELLTNYGEISCIWFDGHWDQTNPEGAKDRSSRVDWKYDEIYSLIHSLQPSCMIGNNHHLDPLPGEDFQMFEQDLPGQNHTGLSFQAASELPLESCITMNDSWGFRITDRKYKSFKEIINTLVGAAGRNSNLLLNVGPMPNGEIQHEFVDTLQKVGQWVKQYGHTIYGTRGGPMNAENWGVTSQNEENVYLHLLGIPATKEIFIPGNYQIAKIKGMNFINSITVTKKEGGVSIQIQNLDHSIVDQIIILPKLISRKQ
jgi:alpha-L-fucosidase